MNQIRLDADEKSIKEFVEHIAANEAAPHTQKRCEHDMKMFADFLGERKISQKISDDYKTAKPWEYGLSTITTIFFGINKYFEYIGCDLRMNSKDRNVYLPNNLCADLRKYCADNDVHSGSIFLTKHGNFPYCGNMTGAIRETCKNTGIDHKKLSMRAFKYFYT